MEKSYDPEWDPYNWYMFLVEKAIRKRERHFGRMKRKIEDGK
jgi:hypothetical protein